MKHYRLILLLLVMVVGFLLAACGGANQAASPTASQDAAVTSHDSLVDRLEAAGTTVESNGEVEQVFFSVGGQIIKVNGEDVQVFEFADAETAEQEAGQIAPDGTSATTTMITWIATPHFYRADKVIVLYVGDNQAVLDLLNSILGEQFAGQ